MTRAPKHVLGLAGAGMLLLGGFAGCVSEDPSLDEVASGEQGVMAALEEMEGGGGGGGGSTYVPPPPKVVKNVITLGDSFASGTGIHTWGSEYDEAGGGLAYGYALTARSDYSCWREKNDTPGPRRAAAKGARSIFLGCKGAQAAHATNQMTVAGLMYPTEASGGWASTEILITDGGNDIVTNSGQSWPDLLKSCIMEASVFNGCHDWGSNQIANFSAIQTTLTGVYKGLAVTAPKATLAVMAYPRLMQPRKDWLGIWHCDDVSGVTGNEARWIDQQVDALNSRIQAAVSATKSAYPSFDIRFVSVNSYVTTGACWGAHWGQINDREGPVWDPSDASFHPTLTGYYAFYDAFLAVVGN